MLRDREHACVTAQVIEPWGIQKKHLADRKKLQTKPKTRPEKFKTQKEYEEFMKYNGSRLPMDLDLSLGGGISSLLYKKLKGAMWKGRLYADDLTND